MPWRSPPDAAGRSRGLVARDPGVPLPQVALPQAQRFAFGSQNSHYPFPTFCLEFHSSSGLPAEV